MRNISINAALEELLRERDLRVGVYERLVIKGEMRQAVADLHTARLGKAIELLRWLQDNERLIKARLQL